MVTMRGIACGAAVTVAALCGLERAAHGVVIYDNLPGSNNGAIPVNQTTYVGERFNTDATNLSITGATLLLQSTTPGTFEVSLFSDVSSHPGVKVGTVFSGTTAAAGVGASAGSIAFSNLALPVLANTNYWMVLSVPVGQSTVMGWAETISNTGTGSGFQAVSQVSGNSGGTWSDNSAFPKMQVVAGPAPAPEPGTLALLVGGLAVLAGRRRRS